MDTLLQEKLAMLKTEIKMQLQSSLARFYEQHGISPSAVHVHMIEVTTPGDRVRVYAPGDVVVEFRV